MSSFLMRTSVLLALAPVVAFVSGSSQALWAGDYPGSQPDRPNIIIFIVDDMGWQDTSVEFHTQRTVWNDLYHTPNMQRLADQGMRFTNAYAASPVCSPTRTSLLTGRNPARTHITDWVGHGQSSNQHLKSPAWAATGLQPGDGQATLPSILKASGYRTAFVGKAHFGGRGTAGADPLNLGFDVNVGGSHVGSPRGRGAQGAYFAPFPKATMPRLDEHDEGAYITKVLTHEATAVIDQAVADDVPFFMLVAHYAIHTPISGQGDPRYVQSYRAASRPEPEDDYAAMIESMDTSLGEILDTLQSAGVAENTLVIFVSDNGGLANHTRNFGGARTVQTLDGRDVIVDFTRDMHNSPLRGGKGSGYEGGLRVPMIASWAGQEPGEPPVNELLPIDPGSRCAEPVITDDFFPTILSLANVPNIRRYIEDDAGQAVIDGVNLLPLLRGESLARSGGIHFHYPHQWYGEIGIGEGIEPFTAIREGDFKLICFYGDGVEDGQPTDPRLELYHLGNDPGERDDLIASEPLIASELRDKLVAWMTRVGAQHPIGRTSGQPVPMPTGGFIGQIP